MPDKTRLQSIASNSSGIVAPANFFTFAGLILVIIGCYQLINSNYAEAIILILIGRLSDIFDGYVARKTKTASRTGEAIDTFCDKLGVFIVITCSVVALEPNLFVACVLAIHHSYLGLLGLTYGRRYSQLSTLTSGKQAMFMSWIAILFILGSAIWTGRIFEALSFGVYAIYCVFAMRAIYQYTMRVKKLNRSST